MLGKLLGIRLGEPDGSALGIILGAFDREGFLTGALEILGAALPPDGMVLGD